MAVVARIIGYSLLTSGLGAGIAEALFGHYPNYTVTFLIASVGAIVGAFAGAAGEIVTAQRRLDENKGALTLTICRKRFATKCQPLAPMLRPAFCAACVASVCPSNR